MKQGFTLLWVGWQFDVPQRPGLMRVYVPTATENGRPIHGVVRSDFVPTEKEFDHTLADRNHLAYAVADPGDPNNVLTVRDSVEGARRIVPRDQWGFARDDNGARIADTTRVYMSAKFEPNKIYEVVYTADNPPLVGLGPAAIRDTISMLKYKPSDALSIPAGRDHAGDGIRRLAERTFPAHVPVRRLQPQTRTTAKCSTASWPTSPARAAAASTIVSRSRRATAIRILNFFYPTDIFPFTDVAQKDPETGVTDGLLTHRRIAGAAAEGVLHELGVRVLGPRRVADSHNDRRRRRRAANGQRPDLSAVCRPARACGIPADADDRTAEEQSARLPVGDESAAPRDGSLDREWHTATAKPLPAHR